MDTLGWADVGFKILQGAFSVAVATVAILTYRRARTTILQPMRAEVFRAQIDLLAALLRHFVGKNEVVLREEMGLPQTAEGNAMKMAGAFGTIMFGIQGNGKPPWEGPAFPQGMCSLQAWKESGFTDEEHPAREPERVAEDPAIRSAIWANYQHDELVLHRQYCEKVSQLREILEAPLLPSRCAALLEQYLAKAHDNIMSIGKSLTEARSDFPRTYHNLDELTSANFLWMSNRCNGSFQDLKPCADQIVAFVRSYFAPDLLIASEWPAPAKRKSRQPSEPHRQSP